MRRLRVSKAQSLHVQDKQTNTMQSVQYKKLANTNSINMLFDTSQLWVRLNQIS